MAKDVEKIEHLKRQKLPKFIQEWVDNLNCPMSLKINECIFLNVSQRKPQAPHCFTREF